MAASNELEGFEVFEPGLSRGEFWVGLIVSGSSIRLTQGSMDILKNPEFVVAFFDRKGKRMMIVPGRKDTPNCIKIGKSNKTVRSSYITCKSLNDEIRRVAGVEEKVSFTVFGHKAESMRPTLIFDLGKVRIKESHGKEEDCGGL